MSEYPDIVSIREHHCTNYKIKLPHYRCFQQNRQQAARATRGSGGVALLVSKDLIKEYNIAVVSCDIEGIIGIKLYNDCEQIYVYSVYLPPKFTTRGVNPDAFFGHLLAEVYKYSDYPLFILGDLNAKLGRTTVPSSSDKTRLSFDGIANAHGHSLVEFLSESSCEILNGYFGAGSNEPTCISRKGKSHVDYGIVRDFMFDRVDSFRVVDITDLVSELDLIHLVNHGSRLPDHNMLVFTYRFEAIAEESFRDFFKDHKAEQKEAPPKVVRRFPENFMSSPTQRQAILDLIGGIEAGRELQGQMDAAMSGLTKILHGEMDEIRAKLTSKRKKTPHKPYWDRALSASWEEMRQAQKDYKRSFGSQRGQLLDRYRFYH